MGILHLGSWFMNFAQYSWKDMNAKVLADIKSPYLEYSIYWTFKSAQVASFIGGCVVHPIYRIFLSRKITPETRTNNSYKVIRNICRKIQGRFLLSGIAAGPGLMLATIFINNYSVEDVRDKCYTIRCDNSGLTYDRFTIVFGLIGWYWKRFQGAVDGVNIAGAYALYHYNIALKYLNPISLNKMTVIRQYADLDEARDNETELLRFSNFRKGDKIGLKALDTKNVTAS